MRASDFISRRLPCELQDWLLVTIVRSPGTCHLPPSSTSAPCVTPTTVLPMCKTNRQVMCAVVTHFYGTKIWTTITNCKDKGSTRPCAVKSAVQPTKKAPCECRWHLIAICIYTFTHWKVAPLHNASFSRTVAAAVCKKTRGLRVNCWSLDQWQTGLCDTPGSVIEHKSVFVLLLFGLTSSCTVDTVLQSLAAHTAQPH